MKKHNFCAGPAIMPPSVMQQMSLAAVDYKASGLSILEISHRSKTFDDIIQPARALAKELLQLNNDYEVLFLTGGASMQFCMLPYNLLPQNGTAAYIDTGIWSKKAIKEAKLFGKTEVVASSEDCNYGYIPEMPSIGNQYAYLHLTTNNTIYGTQMSSIPDSGSPVVADMSSDIFSKPTDGKQFGLIYAGAQKNTGPAGTTLVAVRKDLLGKTNRAIPSMLNYETHIKSASVYNTPPVYAIYGCYLSLQWVKERGLERIAANNAAKAEMLYHEIDRNGLFNGLVAHNSRSTMNVTFNCTQPDLEQAFLNLAIEAGCVGLKGHRLSGGFRASLYNALPIESVKVLVEVMQTFEKKYG